MRPKKNLIMEIVIMIKTIRRKTKLPTPPPIIVPIPKLKKLPTMAPRMPPRIKTMFFGMAMLASLNMSPKSPPDKLAKLVE